MTKTPRSRSTDRRYYGVAVAIVVENEDPEKEGRIKIKIPFFGEEPLLDWVRVRQLYAGGGYGTFWVPEIDDEVLVAFEHGDMRRPIILGGLYNGVDKPPTWRGGDGERDHKMIKTKGGHQIFFDDTDGMERVTISTQGGNFVDLSDVDTSITIRTNAGHNAVIDDELGTISVSTAFGHSLTLDDTRQITSLSSVAGHSVTLDDLKSTVAMTAFSGLAGKLAKAAVAAAAPDDLDPVALKIAQEVAAWDASDLASDSLKSLSGKLSKKSIFPTVKIEGLEQKIVINGPKTVEIYGAEKIEIESEKLVEIRAAKVQVVSEDEGLVTAQNKQIVDSPKVVIDTPDLKIGQDTATEPLVLGNKLLALFNSHIHPTGMGPSGPPIKPMTPAELSKVAKTK